MEFEPLSNKIIGAAIEVHKILGPGMLESAYEECLVYELCQQGLIVERQRPLPIVYKKIRLEYGYRVDLIVENQIIVKLKTVEALLPVHQAQILTYLRFTEIKVGLLINFNTTVLKHGIKRFIQ